MLSPILRDQVRDPRIGNVVNRNLIAVAIFVAVRIQRQHNSERPLLNIYASDMGTILVEIAIHTLRRHGRRDGVIKAVSKIVWKSSVKSNVARFLERDLQH